MAKFKHTGAEQLSFYCPGCKHRHYVNTSWGWNGSEDKPSLTHSVLVTSSRMTAAGRARCTDFLAEHGRYPTLAEIPYDTKNVCHAMVRDGTLQFLEDCTHELVNQTVEIPNYPED